VSDVHLAQVEGQLPSLQLLRRFEKPMKLLQVQESELTQADRTEHASHTLLVNHEEDVRVLALPIGMSSQADAREADHIGSAHAHLLPAAMSPRSLAPLPPAERDNPYRRSRLSDPAARARAIALAGQVDSTRIMRIVEELSTGSGATRFSCRTEVNTFARDYLLDTLRAIFSAPGDTVFEHPFTISGAHCDSVPVELFNLIARRPGRVPGSGRYILGAHYDSIARRTEGWDPATDPAPGADDNASGTACVIEAARILTGASYDFDLEVALFSGEEQVLLGSGAYTADSLAQMDDVLGAIILDMVGYNPRAADSLNVLTNFTSEWLAEVIQEAEAALPGDQGLTELDKVVEPLRTYSDHASFWNHGDSAILLIENVNITSHNPNYHRVSDTIEMLEAVGGSDLMRRVSEVVVATLGQFAAPEGEFAIPEAGILFFRDDGRFTFNSLAGQTVHVKTRVLNAGPARQQSTEVHATLTLGGTQIAQRDTSFADWGSGVWREIVVPWTPEPEQAGFRTIRANLTLRENGNLIASLAADSAPFEVRTLGTFEAVIFPNPVRGSLAAGELRLLRLGSDVDLRCQVLDALGGEVGRFEGRVSGGEDVSLQALIEAGELPSGIYVLLLEIRPPGGTSLLASDKLTFAYMR
jgi:hypothetical protein